jgi:hypothetical protein
MTQIGLVGHWSVEKKGRRWDAGNWTGWEMGVLDGGGREWGDGALVSDKVSAVRSLKRQ